MPTLERGRSKHNELVAQLNRANIKRDKAVATLLRIEAKRVSLIRAVGRSQKRLTKLSTAALVNAPLEPVFNDEPMIEHIADTLDIPAIFDRRPNAADEKAKAEIIAAKEAHKKQKAAGQKAKRKATLAGDRRKMPPQGKDAIKAIFG